MIRKIICLIVLLVGQLPISIAQDIQNNVNTPKKSSVNAWVTEEASDVHRSYAEHYFDITYPNPRKIPTYGTVYSATRRFNCHGYAWYMTDEFGNQSLNNPRWIGYYLGNTDEDIYMTDGSYVQVANEMYPGKVSWSLGDHSAITTSEQGIFISKWNESSLYEHNWDDTPYGTSGLKYYVSTHISGNFDILCNNNTRTFTTRNISGATYTWNVGSGLTLNSNGNYSTTITANSSYSGSTWIEVTIKSPIGGGNYDTKTSKRFAFWVGKPSPPAVAYSGFVSEVALGCEKKLESHRAPELCHQVVIGEVTVVWT